MRKRSVMPSTPTTIPSVSTTVPPSDMPQDTPCKNCMKDKEWKDGLGKYRCWDCPRLLTAKLSSRAFVDG